MPSGVPPAGQNQFTDVSGSWAAGYIDQLQQVGVITVPADRLFHPNQPVSRLDFAVWVSRALELPAPSAGAPKVTFKDESLIPAQDQAPVAAAVAAGLLKGYTDGRFHPTAPITRAAIATIFGRALEAKGETPDARYFAIWADGAQIPSWALPATVVMKDHLIYGEPCSPEACFAPLADTTRAEATAFIVRFMQYVSQTYPQAPLPPPTPPSAAPGLAVEAWYSNSSEAYSQLQQFGGDISLLIYGGYSIASGGQLVGFDSPRTLAWARAHPADPLWVMVQAHSLSFLASGTQQQALLQSVVATVQRAGYAGVNFDIEGVPGAERQAFSDFIASAAADLHAVGAKISVDVPTETASDLGESWDAAYDYQALGQSADQVIMMAYDYHYAGGAPGPISPIGWERAAISYAAGVMPPSKVILGLPLYGYVWNTATDAGTAYWESGMYNTAQANNAPVIQDPTSDEGTFAYTAGGSTYVGWFVDGQGATDRLAMAHQMGIGGVCVWRMDYSAPDWWPVFSQALSQWR